MSDTELKRIVKAFHEAQIEFVLIGGLAMIAHGSSYVTRDVDFAYAIGETNVERLAAFLATIHARVLGRPPGDGFVIQVSTLLRVKFLNTYTDLGEIDVMREIPGVESFDVLRERAITMDFGGFPVNVASIDDLLAMKRAANRPKDQLHIYELLALKKLKETEL